VGALAWAEVVGAHATAEARGVESAVFGNDVACAGRRAARYRGARAGAARIPIGRRSGLVSPVTGPEKSFSIHTRQSRSPARDAADGSGATHEEVEAGAAPD